MTREDPVRIGPDDPQIAAILALLRDSFAYMQWRIDPPSSLTRMTAQSLNTDAAEKELWIIPGPMACVILTAAQDHLYVGKLAVARDARGQGLARRLFDLADERARALNLPRLQLQTRIELIENQATFTTLGFRETARTAHEGYDRPTSITYERAVPFPPT